MHSSALFRMLLGYWRRSRSLQCFLHEFHIWYDIPECLGVSGSHQIEVMLLDHAFGVARLQGGVGHTAELANVHADVGVPEHIVAKGEFLAHRRYFIEGVGW